MRLGVAVAVAFIAAIGLSVAGEASASVKRHTAIATQGLGPALQQLASERDVQFVYRSEVVGDRQTAGASGELTFEEALTRLLEGTGLTYQFLGEKAITIIPRPNSTTHVERSVAPYDETRHRASTMADSQGVDAAGRSGGMGDSIDLWSRFRLAQSDQEGGSSSAAEAKSEASATGQPVAQLNEILVTAQKREERLQDVPVPVTAIGARTLIVNNQLRIQDFAASVPGFSSSPSPSAGGQQQLAIRGISTGFNTNPTVGITVDDVPYGASTNLVGNSIPDIDPNDIERVEVLRGPQGALYGASSMGGLVKYVTVDPSTDEVSGRLEAGLNSVHNGDELGYNARASFNLPLGDTLAMRASIFTRQDSGYIDNPVTGVEGVNEARVNGGRIGALWRPSDVVSLKLSALLQEAEGDGTNDVTKLPGFGDLEQNYLPEIGAYNRKSQAYSATLSAELGAADLTAISGYNDTDFRDSFDFTYLLGPFFGAGVPVFTHNESKKFSQEIRLSTPIGPKLEWLMGAFYTDEDTPQVQDVRTADPVTGELGDSLLGLEVPTKYEEYAVFSNLTIQVTDRFDLQIGGRQSWITHSLSETQTGPLAGPPKPETESEDSPFTYLVTPRFRISPDLMVYGRFASGYRAGGPNGNPDPAVPPDYEPDETQNYEFGLKGSFLDNTLSLDGSIYYINWDKLQLNLVSPNNGQTYTTNGSRAESKGIEISVALRPVTGLAIAAWFVYSDSELTEDIPAGQGVFGSDGNRLPYGSRTSGHVSIDQEFSVGDRLTGSIGASASYVGDRVGTFIGPPLTPSDRQSFPSYSKIDLRAGLRGNSWSGILFVTNVADERGVLGGGAGTFPPYAFSVIQPRAIGLTISKSF